ncbi:MAG: Do family serine endopeptidase [Alphaproteobacteria bacterium]|nr:Do family serine endopeptidase [Alphaproteobacteria bacterium]
MTRHMLFILIIALSVGIVGHSAHAQIARQVPSSQAQVQLSYAPIVKKTAPAVVNIYTQKLVRQRVISPFMGDPFFQHFFGAIPQGMSRQRLENSLGSGVIVKPEGVIVTSNHVIDGADEITVVLSDRREFQATLVLTDEGSDLAVLKINPKGELLPFIELEDSDAAEVGDIVIAIGNPFGVGQTVTSGIISAMARTSLDMNDVNYYIQTDAAINPGNSGGALITMDGRLIGINAAIYTKDGGNMGLGFAVPSNMVRSTLENSIAEDGGRKTVVRPWTGIGGQPVTSDMAKSLGLASPMGLLVNSLHEASPAKKAGLKVGDVIVSLNGKPIQDPSAFAYRVATTSIGKSVDLDVVRKGQHERIKLPLISPPENTPRDEALVKGQSPLSGAKIANLSPAVAAQYRLSEDVVGVVIVAVDPDSAAAELGLAKGDIIVGVNGKDIGSVKDVLAAASVQGRRGWRLVINRGGGLINMMIRR